MAEAQIFEIKTYMIIWRQLEHRDFNGVEAKIRGMVRWMLSSSHLTAPSPTPTSISPTKKGLCSCRLPICRLSLTHCGMKNRFSDICAATNRNG
jgi:hypothetical protein